MRLTEAEAGEGQGGVWRQGGGKVGAMARWGGEGPRTGSERGLQVTQSRAPSEPSLEAGAGEQGGLAAAALSGELNRFG